MQITSTAFPDNDFIPEKYTCNGRNVSPPLTFSQTPRETVTFALIVEDPDAPQPDFTHWILYNIPGSTMQLLEDEVPASARTGMNDLTHTGYDGPCPPTGTHRYVFRLFALDTKLDLQVDVSRRQVEQVMKGHIIDSAELTGRYQAKR